MISHLSLIRIVMHSNVIGVLSATLTVLGFDIMAEAIDWEDQTLIGFSEDAQNDFINSTLAQIHDVGYESHSALINLNTISLAIFIYMF